MVAKPEDVSQKFAGDLIAQDITYSILSVDPPSELFHYTSPSALVSISQTKEIWASRAAYMNDASEHVIAYETIGKVLRDEIDGASAKEEVEYLEGLLDMARACSGGAGTFIVSLSEIGDLLSQWRAYVPKAGTHLASQRGRCARK